MRRIANLCLLTCLFIPLANVTAAQAQATKPPAVVGKWKLVTIEMRGKTQTPGKLGLMWQIEEEAIRIRLAGYSQTKHECVIDESKTPHHLSWTLRSGKRMHTTNAIYEVDGDTLKVCLINGSEDRPTSFETTGEDNKNHTVFTFERDETP